VVRKSFKDLVVWQKSRIMVKDIYTFFNDCRDYAFRDQIQRASVSIVANIAEGYDKESKKDFSRFLKIAKGSNSEVRALLVLANDLGYINDITSSNIDDTCVEISKMLFALIRTLETGNSKLETII
jgi:four helix bundle protein